ncbi:MAG: sulfotransferase [Nevskia sp.]
MLGSHPRLQNLPELNAFLAPTIEGLLELFALTDGSPGHGLLRAVAAVCFGAQSEPAVEQARAWLRRRADWTGAMLLDAFARSLAPQLLISADTGIGWRPDQLYRLLDTCPDLRILHLIEHPRPWCRARAAALGAHLFVAPDFKDYGVNPPIIDPQLAWHRVHTNLECAFETRPAAQYRRLRVEDLHAAPEATLASLCDWLGVAAAAGDIERMQHPEGGPFSGYGPATALHGADEAFLESPYFLRRLPARETLAGPLDWCPDRRGFAAEIFTLAAGYRYA